MHASMPSTGLADPACSTVIAAAIFCSVSEAHWTVLVRS